MTNHEAIQFLNNMIGEEHGRSIGAEGFYRELCAYHVDALRMAIKALEQTKWIPVSERLPEKNMECLVAVGKFNLTQMAMYSDLMGIIDHRIFYQGYADENFDNITQYVKAWMPLPEPYKAESEDKE